MEVLNGKGEVDSGGDAAVINRSVVGIKNGISISAKEAAGHEAYHIWKTKAMRESYTETVLENVNWRSEEFQKLYSHINKNYFNRKLDMENPQHIRLFNEELVAYISGSLHSGENMEGILRSADRVLEAWNKLKGSVEGRNSLKGTTELLNRIDEIAKQADSEGWSHEEIRAKQQEAVQEVYQKLIDEYGAMKPGEKAAREIEVPKKSGEGEKVYQTVRTILEGQATPDEMVPRIQELVDKGELSYEALSDKKAIERAENVIQSKGWAETYADWMKDSREGKISKEHTALGWALYNNAANSGNTEVAIGILMAVVGNQHDAAQAVQATRIFKQLTPEGQFYGIVQSVERMQQELNQKYGDKKAPRLRVDEELGEEFLSAETEERQELNPKYGGKKVPRLRIDEELGAEFLSAETEEQRDEARKNIYRDIGRQMPSRFRDRWNAWRYLSMLGNTRTHVRNIFGNFFFAPVVAVKDTVATGMEAAVGKLSKGKLERTKGLAGLNSELAKAAWADYAKAAPAIMDGGKYGDLQNANKYVEEGRKVFGNTRFEAWNKTGGRVWETLRKENGKWLDKEDSWFAKPHYVTALSQYCAANHITAEQLREGKLPAVEKARSYAIREAQKATYRDCNELSDFFSSLGSGLSSSSSKVNRAMGIAVEGILPFRKTPANILARGLEYSPAGLIKSLTYDLVEVSKGNMTGAEAIDHISAGLTGTGLFALGMAAAAARVVRGHGSGDEEENEFEELMGHQSYALELPNGTSVTLDWLAPECLPFFVGVNLWEQLQANNGELTLSTLLNAATTVTEPLLEMSCLQSLNAIFDAVGYAKSDGLDGLPAALASAATSYLTQAVPTLAGQLERIGEDKRYTTYTGKNSALTSDMQYTLGKLSAKIPGVDYSQIPYVDAWGRMEKTGSLGTRAFNNLVNPAYVSQIDTSEMEEELLRLYKATGEASVFPSRAAKYINVDGKRMDLSAEEYVQYATLKGQKSYELLGELVKDKRYTAMTEEQKVKAVEEAYDLANQEAKKALTENYETESWVAKSQEAKKKYGIKQDVFITLKVQASQITALKDTDGETITNSRGLLIMDMVYNTPGLTEAQRNAMFEYLGVGKKIRHLNKAAVKEKLEKMKKGA